jgi:hypothetical protein
MVQLNLEGLKWKWSWPLYCTITPRSRGLPNNLIVLQLIKKFSTFYGIRMFIAFFTRAHNWSLTSARCIQSTPTHPTLFFHLHIYGNKLRQEEPRYGIALGYGLDDRRLESRQGLVILLFITASRPALGPTNGYQGLFPWW